ncbi:RHS repeat-associated core domain-containing protein [Diaphorobacter aerolatus]|uniref:RHS domain-containing protein n=1 Tax=Diaphorobacter aerolatus TaxID=1288495 RepID=A0A7H0GGF1_9BURK|nr:RHS repeat-associated core domain-containing protein [Diaphorobacter aerolatus]QNP47367.1 RHS domain-containing protein [Diaphorobacter aerolatus]
MELAYDKGNQLVQVVVHEKDDGEEEEGTQLTQRYRYDAFGRRLAKYSNAGNTGHTGHTRHKDAGEESGTTDYFGWDGDRLVHTERLNHGNARDIDGQSQPEIVHTVYEPGSFTPLVQLRRAARAAQGMADELIAHLPAGMARDALRAMLTDINATSALLNERIVGLGMAADAQSFINAQRQEFEETARSERQENAKSVEVRHYLCDHLGTPNALFSSEGQVEWAATLDAWGNVKDEYSPKRLYQPIRLPGQHEDDATALYYNRHRYYQAEIGFYTNKDPIGLHGGWNQFVYVNNPAQFFDPLGLQGWSSVPILNGSLPGNQGALSEAMKGPPPPVVESPALPFSIFMETNAGAQGVYGKAISTGKAFGMRKDLSIINCNYSTSCDLLGLGVMYGVGVAVGGSDSAPSSGVSRSTGGYVSGGALGSAGVQGTTDVATNSTSISVAVAKGDGFSVSKLDCTQNTDC